ncbi:MAG: valine--tRNA ligase [Eubacteriaceae bacterium]|nr:valine--tRNA ligase [Eubacteriaceae bacterium]
MKKELGKTYDPQEIETGIYEMWEHGGYFKPEINPEGKPYTIVLPPPNITGQLHLGHALDCTLQDILIRYKRMQGYSVLWVPGEDHASIATEVKVTETIFAEENKTKEQVGREKFLERAWKWSDYYRNQIATQLRKIGSSLDWSRERFTMDEKLIEAVKESFISMYNKGLVYKDYRIINWCPDCKTALSDTEVDFEEESGNLWHIKYPLLDGGNFVIATTRPETMLGDTGIAVNPDDERYTALVGKTAILPLLGRELPIVADSYVDKEFGTGCLKVTPCHDINDFEIGKRHNLAQVLALDENACINENGGKYCGMDRYEARKAVLADLQEQGLIVKTEEIAHNVGHCYRCKSVVEPITSMQWFVSMKPLAEPAIEVVKNGQTVFVPDRFKKIYFTWMENVRDWCISRQLWWGHRIPAYYCDKCGYTAVAKEAPEKCAKCGCLSFTQDEDVLDTWFSSALWPFSTLGWPEDTEDLARYYPNDVLVTGFDIIFFWVARMIFSGIEHTGSPPFHHVYIHGLIRDPQGRKMSKSLGNGVDPLEVIERHGADALRAGLIAGTAAGQDIRWNESKVQAYRNFCNKLNNAARFALINLDGYDPSTTVPVESLESMDKWVISRTNDIVKEVSANLDKYELGIAFEKLYSFFWDEFCDWYIELVKLRLSGEDGSSKLAAQWTLYHVFIKLLKLLHPFMPYITEHIYSCFIDDEKLITASWPEFSEAYCYAKEEAEIGEVMAAIKAVRNARAEQGIAPSKKSTLYIAAQKEWVDVFNANLETICRLASASHAEVVLPGFEIGDSLVVSIKSSTITIPLGDLIDKEKELKRLETEKSKTAKEAERLSVKLSNASFIEKAPQAIVDGEKRKLADAQALLSEIELAIEKLV